MGSGSGRGFEGDLVAQGFELADVAALAAFGADAGVVEVAAEVVVAGAGVGEQVPDDDQQDRPMATTAFFLPRRRAMRRYRSPTKVSVWAAETAALPSTRAR
jgi:hypothetical protein